MSNSIIENTPKIPILGELYRLKQLHSSSRVDHSTFQPTEEQQRELIVRNSARRLVMYAIKREKTKYLFNERARAKADNESTEKTGFGMNSRPASAPAGDANSDLNKTLLFDILLSKEKMKQNFRPQTSLSDSKRSSSFAAALKGMTASSEVSLELINQAQHQTKDAKRLFEIICHNFGAGSVCQFHPRRRIEEIDVSHLAVDNTPLTATGNGLSKLESLTTVKKKDGIMIIFDPSTNTGSEHFVLRVTFMKAIDIVRDEKVVKDYTFWSDGNYFGLRFCRDNLASLSTSFMVSSSMSMGSMLEAKNVGLAGWHMKAPIFIPAQKCSLEVIDIDGHASKNASIASNLSRLRLYAVCSSSGRTGLKRIQEFLEQEVLKDTANLMILGGLAALNLASMHGNLEAVQQLVESGANINFRCRAAKHLTALHEAVIGGHEQVVLYLLHQGANQLLKDDSGMCPLHHACKMGNIAMARILMNHSSGRRALVIANRLDQKPIDLCLNTFIKSCVEGVMRQFHIFSKPRVSILDRVNS